jgi:hypothetical protein
VEPGEKTSASSNWGESFIQHLFLDGRPFLAFPDDTTTENSRRSVRSMVDSPHRRGSNIKDSHQHRKDDIFEVTREDFEGNLVERNCYVEGQKHETSAQAAEAAKAVGVE